MTNSFSKISRDEIANPPTNSETPRLAAERVAPSQVPGPDPAPPPLALSRHCRKFLGSRCYFDSAALLPLQLPVRSLFLAAPSRSSACPRNAILHSPRALPNSRTYKEGNENVACKSLVSASKTQLFTTSTSVPRPLKGRNATSFRQHPETLATTDAFPFPGVAMPPKGICDVAKVD